MPVMLQRTRQFGIGDWQPITCPDAPGGITQQMFPDGQCHPVFAAGDYADPAAELWRRCLTDPTACQLIAGNVPISAQPYQTPQPDTPASIAANASAASITPTLSTTPTRGVPTSLIPLQQGFSIGGTSIPIWMLAAGALLIFLAVKK